MARFKIIHLSDLHFASTPRRTNIKAYAIYCATYRRRPAADASLDPRFILVPSHCPDLTKKAAKLVLENRRGQNLILISGDLGASGQIHDLSLGRRCVTVAPRPNHFLSASGEPTFAFPGLPVFLMPGNHDRYEDHRGRAGCQNFERVFRSFWGVTGRYVQAAVLRDRQSGDMLGLVAADFCLSSDADAMAPTFFYRAGQGNVADEPLKELCDKTVALRERHPGIAVVWVSHFPPAAGAAGSNNELKLLNYERLLKAAGDHDINLILSGHIHNPVRFQEGSTAIQCAGSAVLFIEPNGNWIHFLELETSDGRAELVGKVDFCWDEDQGEFLRL